MKYQAHAPQIHKLQNQKRERQQVTEKFTI